MNTPLPATRRRFAPALAVLAAALLLPALPARGYVEIPYALGRILQESTNVVVLRVEQVDKTKNTIIYRKVRDLKGTHPGDTVKHNIGTNGFNPREWQGVMAWAEVGKTALFFHNGAAGEVCIDGYWYQVYPGEWWNMSHAEPYLLRTYAGKPEKLATAVEAVLKGQEVTLPCMVDGDKNALHLRTARLQRMKASMKIQDYDPKRDFAGWGVEEFRTLAGMPGFTHYAALARTDPGATGVGGRRLRRRRQARLLPLRRVQGRGPPERRQLAQRNPPAGRGRRPGRLLGRLQRRRQARPAPRHPHRPAPADEPGRRQLPRRLGRPAQAGLLQPDRPPPGSTTTATASRTSCWPTASAACGCSATSARKVPPAARTVDGQVVAVRPLRQHRRQGLRRRLSAGKGVSTPRASTPARTARRRRGRRPRSPTGSSAPSSSTARKTTPS